MAGYSGTPLVKKLGIKRGNRVITVNPPDHYRELLGELPQEVQFVGKKDNGPVDFIHLFAKDRETLLAWLRPMKEKLKKDGMLWVSWIKGSSKHQTDIKSQDVREAGLGLGLVDIKVCAVDEDWSGLKFVYRKEDR